MKPNLFKRNTVVEGQFIYKGIFIFLTIIILAILVKAAVEDAGEVYYTMDSAQISGNDLDDIAPNDIDAVISGATSNSSGIIDEALEFQGAEFVNSTWTGQSRTVTFWVNTLQTSGGIIGQRYAASEADGDWNFELDGAGNGKLVFYECDGGNCDCAFGAAPIQNEGWVFIAVVANNSNNRLEIYKNATLIATETTCSVAGYDGGPFGRSGAIPSENNLQIGRRGDNGAWSYIDGVIDEVGIWNQTLNGQNLTDLYNGGAGYQPLWATNNFTISGITDDYNSTSITTFNLTMYNGTSYYFWTTNGTIGTDIADNSTDLFNITFYGATSYLNNTWYNYNISSDVTSFSAIFNQSRHNITAWRSPLNTTQIYNFTVNSSEGTTLTTNNGFMIFPTSWNTTTTLYFNSTNLTAPAISTGGTTNDNLNFSAYRFQTFYLEFYDEVKNTLITDHKIFLELISDVYGNNYSTVNGTMLLELLTPADYILRYVDNETNYFERSYYTNISSENFDELDLYLLNDTYTNLADSDGVDITILDTVNTELSGATINVNKYFPNSNSYITVERLETNFEGETVSYLTNDEFYRFVIEYEDIVRLSTSSTRVYDTALTFIIDIVEDPTGDFKNFVGISTDLEYINASNNFVLTYTDSDQVATQICLEVYETTFTGETRVGSSCSGSQSGSIIIGITPANDTTFTGKAYASIGGTWNLLDILTIHFAGDKGFDFGNNGLIIVLILTLVFVFTGIFNPVIMLLLAPLPLLIGSIIGFVQIPIGVALAVYTAFIIVMIVVGRRS